MNAIEPSDTRRTAELYATPGYAALKAHCWRWHARKASTLLLPGIATAFCDGMSRTMRQLYRQSS